MRVLILGASGMLGHKLYQRLTSQHEVAGTIRGDIGSIERFQMFETGSIIEGVTAEDIGSVERAIVGFEPDCIVNTIGLIKQLLKTDDVVRALGVNSIFPHRLKEIAKRRGTRVITISTDCVFDGAEGNYSEADPTTARDLYGLSKLLGELTGPGCLTLRTSMIGRELISKNSIVEWFLANRSARVKGFRQAMYSGLTTLELSEVIARLISEHPDLDGLFHVAGSPISKYELLCLINQAFNADILIEPDDRIAVDRTLNAELFARTVNYAPPDWRQMIATLAADPTPYDSFRDE